MDTFKPQRLLPPQHLKTPASCPWEHLLLCPHGSQVCCAPGFASLHTPTVLATRLGWRWTSDPCAPTRLTFPRSPETRKLAQACYSHTVQLKPSHTYSSSSKMFSATAPGLSQPTSPLNPWRGRHGDSRKPLHARPDRRTPYKSMNESVNPESP